MKTYPDMARELGLKEQRAAHSAAVVADWRRRNPWATCGDRVALILADLERSFGGALRAKGQEAR